MRHTVLSKQSIEDEGDDSTFCTDTRILSNIIRHLILN